MSFDLLLAASQLLLTVGVLPTLFNSESYVPRRSSLLLTAGLLGMTIALIGLNAPFGAMSTILGSCVWFGVFLLRGQEKSD